ncbi:MAG: glutamate formimidoyltransferase, partial [Planctomycetota bacterium]
MPPLLESVPNFSEGRRPKVIEAITGSMLRVEGVHLLGSEMDHDHNRAVVTLAGEAGPLEDALLAGAAEAIRRIDLNRQHGQHPRIGAMDVCPLVPLGDTPMELAIESARRLATRLGDELSLPAFLYEMAAERAEKVDLASLRRGGFEGLGQTGELRPDRGPSSLHPTAGATAVGARFYLLAYNINLGTENLRVAKKIAAQIRERDGGLPKVKALGFRLQKRGMVQVSMNLCDYRITGLGRVYDAVRELASSAGV